MDGQYSYESKRNRMYKMLRGISNENKDKFQWDDEATWSFTDLQLGRGICEQLLKMGLTSDAVITDATASVGGNTIAFAEYFRHVYSIELNDTRCAMLKHNMTLLRLNEKVTVICGRLQDHIHTQVQDVIFFDPPWGTNYKKHEFGKMKIVLGDQPVEDIVLLMLECAKLCIVKLPQNYDLDGLDRVLNMSGHRRVHIEWHGKPNTCVIVIYA